MTLGSTATIQPLSKTGQGLSFCFVLFFQGLSFIVNWFACLFFPLLLIDSAPGIVALRYKAASPLPEAPSLSQGLAQVM